MTDTGESRLRIDKWLWFARLVRTRTAAQRLAVSGRVRINREKNTSASQLIRVGDVLTVTLDSGVRVLRVMHLGERRGPAVLARTLYEDLSPPAPGFKAATARTTSGWSKTHQAQSPKAGGADLTFGSAGCKRMRLARWPGGTAVGVSPAMRLRLCG